jgi:nucleotide-binding universal stress UspA family protein
MKIDGPILVATALGRASDEALRQAHRIAEATGNLLAIVHVLPEIVGFRPLFPELHMMDREQSLETERLARVAMREQWTRVLGTEPGASQMHLESGTPHSGVIRCAEELFAGLIVVGSGSRAAGTSLGGVAERIVRHAHCPVLIACPPTGGPVIAATDFSDPALPAVQWGSEEARRRNARFSILHAVDVYAMPVEFPEGQMSQVPMMLIETRREDARERLKQIEAKFEPSGGVILRDGPADTAILGAAEQLNAELVVIGTHGRTGFARLALGSVAEGVVRHARTSVLVVRLAK